MTEDNNTQNIHVQDIMHYESKIWEVADLLLAAGIKQSDFPVYMMPFFALVMVEGRMINTIKRVEKEYGVTASGNTEEFKALYDAEECGYNEYIVMQNKTLQSICKNDNTFEQDFTVYLKAFDDVLKQLLGIEREKFLNMDGIVAELRKKGILLEVASAWAQIDLAPYDNSAITTLEEHIKRRWADISASTAGEQYTPEDIIELIARIVALKVNKPKDELLHGYDPTCGGANLLFGVSDRLKKQGYKHIKTYGSELNDALYALAAIESRFREMSVIKCGNTLTTVPFADMEESFDFIVANPPYGTKWKGYEKEIKNDRLGQFPADLPSISDGQLLFMQHILWQLADTGIAVEVHNGSTLFSGDAGSGESNIRKYIFDKDWVEAIIQMPQQEFFNTGIYTYLWIMNKNKPLERKGKVALIDGSNLWQPLKKSKGDKRREMGEEHQTRIVEALANFEPSDICKIYDREHFYYNKQSLTLTEISDDGKYVEETVCEEGKAFVIKHPTALTVGDTCYNDLKKLSASDIKTIAKRVTEEKLNLVVSVETEKEGVYAFCPERCTIIHTKADGTVRDLGCGAFAFKASTGKKGTINKISIEPYTTGDYEIIPHHKDETANTAEINAFMDKYVFKPYSLGKNIVGVEINFNKEFYVPEKLEKTKGLNPDVKMKDSGIEWIGEIPEHWERKRMKDIAYLYSGLTGKAGEDFRCDDISKTKPYIPFTSILNNSKIDTTNFPQVIMSEDENQNQVKENDLLFLMSSEDYESIAKSAVVSEIPGEVYLNSFCRGLRFTAKDVCANFVNYQLQATNYRDALRFEARGFTRINIKIEKISGMFVSLPSFEEQQAIATYLDEKCSKIDSIVANLEKQIGKYADLKRSLIDEVITGKRAV